MLEALCRRGFKLSDAPIERGVGFLLETQERDGSWYGRWGVNYLYGTFLALRGLRAAQDPSASKAMWKAGKWIASVQNEDGGWGESCASYNEGHFVPAPSTPSQTAWALLGLVAAGQGDTEVLVRGVRHLIDTQKPDGTWWCHYNPLEGTRGPAPEQCKMHMNCCVASGPRALMFDASVRYMLDVGGPRFRIGPELGPGIFIQHVDITARKRAELEMWRSLEREKELSQLKTNFVSMVSHEFRTPLGIILSSAQILRDYLDQLPQAERCEHLDAIAAEISAGSTFSLRVPIGAMSCL